jgi:LuxR family transcriptional regulator, maltose regulon positive regulatory protein
MEVGSGSGGAVEQTRRSAAEPAGRNRAWVPVPASQARPPRVSWPVLERRRLLRWISRSVEEFPLTLVSAPAGSGKTVLAADWSARTGKDRPVAWVTVSERDEQPGVFWAHLRLALSLVGVLASDAAPPMFPDSTDVDVLSVALLQMVLPVVLVIDATDRLHGRVVFDQLARLMDNAGDRLRVLVTTRTEPPLPLHRYRVEGRVAELRGDELSLTRTEVAKVLAQHGLPTSRDVTDDVLRRTEGWAAGVRLAALRLSSYDDAVLDAAVLDGFASDYLREEVVDRLAPGDRDVLLRTSIVDELPPGLAPALTDRRDADDVIRSLSSGHVFVAPVRGRADAFRMHPLLRELMIAELDHAAPEAAGVLHRRAAEWFRAAGMLELAVSHAAAAEDWEHAASLVLDGPALGDLIVGTTAGAALVEHLSAMPERDSADVRLLRAVIALGEGELHRARSDLARSGEGADGRRTLLTAVVRTAWHDAAGRPDETLAVALEARSQLAAVTDEARPDLLMAAVMSAEGTAQLHVGDLDAACSALGAALEATADVDGPFRLRCLAELSLAEACRGRLSRALRLADAAEQQAAEQGVPAANRPAASELARAWVALERQELALAQRCLDRGVRLRRADADAWATMTALLRARLMRDRGDGSSARRLLGQTERPTGWLADHLDAEAFAVGLGRPGQEEPDPGSHGRPRRKPATPAHRVHSLLERADARCRAGASGSAKVDVARALTMAQSERLRRPFTHTSPRIRAMVRNDVSLYAKAGWLRPEQLGPAHARPTSPDPEPVPESLSERELEVLQHLSELLTTDEIAAAMFISVNTVRTHVRRILEKLDVSRRNEAVRRARDLGLV